MGSRGRRRSGERSNGGDGAGQACLARNDRPDGANSSGFGAALQRREPNVIPSGRHYAGGFAASAARFFFSLARLAASASAIAFAEGANPARKAS